MKVWVDEADAGWIYRARPPGLAAYEATEVATISALRIPPTVGGGALVLGIVPIIGGIAGRCQA